MGVSATSVLALRTDVLMGLVLLYHKEGMGSSLFNAKTPSGKGAKVFREGGVRVAGCFTAEAQRRRGFLK
jgi:hypothetical protein